MKKIFTFFLAFFSTLITLSQTHYCAEYKAQRFNKTAASNIKKTSSAQSMSAIPAENKYDLKFHFS